MGWEMRAKPVASVDGMGARLGLSGDQGMGVASRGRLWVGQEV